MRNPFTTHLIAAIVAVAGSFLLFGTTARADSTGLVGLHNLVRHGNRLCMDGHYHYGADSSVRSRTAALRNAKRKWADFVILEYGTDWGRFSLAANRGATCSGNRSSGWHCSVEASPCKLLRVKARARRHVKKRVKRYYKRRRYAIRHSRKHRHTRRH